ncbi:hypothetical protein DY245_40800 [Streptomyces inhibens]|uniref:WXG100 family type VII secretion target n=1 Tax=Streptomyces inhibens TaxID=2293571 RepID=A0A371PQS8_STRIH|nr:hypothetical protein [Streptomyces inhibens]REK84868.1 hypothetical protein DY245_40800 [Streptomyces inhibens]
MAEQFKVDLDELDSVVRQLKHLRGDMDEPSQKMKYSTAIPKSAFGVDFLEAGKLASAHDDMQSYMSQVIDALQDLIHKFGEKTEASRGAYEDQEHQAKTSMNG